MEKGVVLIPVGPYHYAQVDHQDAHLSEAVWHIRVSHGIAYAESRGRHLHREIMHPPPGFVVDHKNGDGLDNRRKNLRVVTQSENLRNVVGARSNSTSGVLGVSWHKGSKRWVARIFHEGKNVNLGKYVTKEEAAAARLAGERELWGVQPRRAAAHLEGGEAQVALGS